MKHAIPAGVTARLINRPEYGEGVLRLSTHPCRHADWIAQPMHRNYLFHCCECAIIVSHDIHGNQWVVSREPDRIEVTDPSEKLLVFSALDQWMSERESIYGHVIFVHPSIGVT